MESHVELDGADMKAFARVVDAMMAEERIHGDDPELATKPFSDYLKVYSLGHPLIVRSRKVEVC
jgi:hypothetical protein